MQTIQQIVSYCRKALASFYNMLPSKFKIGVMVATSFLIAGWLNLFTQELINYNSATSNEYTKVFITALLPLMTIVVNLFQQWGVDVGTRDLAKEGDRFTIAKLQNTVVEKQELLDQSK
jgi:hypothetical protein